MTNSTLSQAIEQTRNIRPTTPDHLWHWVRQFTGVKIAREAVCRGHTAPFDLFARQVLERPSLALWHGPRGSGKSFLSAIDTHLSSRFQPRHSTRILGGSLAQSEQIYQAVGESIRDGYGSYGSDADTIRRILQNEVFYHNGSHIAVLAASQTSVRGPHVASLKLDEIDEIDSEIRDAALGMVMEKRGCSATVLMTSTWHKVAGPMADLIERGQNGDFPVATYCVFEVLERCPKERSGPKLEHCPACPLVKWCHSDRDSHPSGLPKAKRSRGHYTIDTLIQKVKAVSNHVFESDYLCLRPRATNVWFTMFDEHLHVTPNAEVDHFLPVHLSIDPGVHTGAVWFQVRRGIHRRGFDVNVFADYFAEGLSAESNARAIFRKSHDRCGISLGRARVSMDPAGNARTAVGPTVRGEYERAGCRGRDGLESWPMGSKIDGLNFVEALLKSADDSINLVIHPRCRHLIEAMQCYSRAKHGNQLLDYAKDPQHPYEDLIDPLCGGLKLEFPQGRTPPPQLRSIHASQV